MAIATAAQSRPPTVADLLEQLGNIPPERVRMCPTPGTATEADLLCPENSLCELVDGVLVEKAVGYSESVIAGVLIQILNNFLDEHPLGVASGEAGFLRLEPGLVRGPDVTFVSRDRFPNRRLPTEPIPDLVPDLAVEVISKSNTEAEMKRKRREYFAAGTRLVWCAYPKTRTVRVYTDPRTYQTLTEDDTLDGGTVIPGFRLSIRDWFERAQRRLGR